MDDLINKNSELELMRYSVGEMLGTINACINRAVASNKKDKELMVIDICWRTFSHNLWWLVCFFDSKNVTYWQVAFTTRLLLEIAADTSQLLAGESKTKDINQFLSQIEKIPPRDNKKYAVGLIENAKKLDANNETKISETTIKRVKKYFGDFGVQQYNILSQATHLNAIGTLLSISKNDSNYDILRYSCLAILPQILEQNLAALNGSKFLPQISTIAREWTPLIRDRIRSCMRNSNC